MGVPARATVRVGYIPPTAVARELLDYFEAAVGPVYACEIAASHRTWKSRGFGRVQFESAAAAERACLLAAEGSLPPFQRARLAVSRSFDDIVARAADARGRVGRAVLRAGVMVGERTLAVLERWEGVAAEVMPERKRLELFLEDGGEKYKLEINFGDILGTFACCVGGGGGGGEEESNAVLLQLKYAPRIYRKLSGSTLNSKFSNDRYHICKEDLRFLWVRTSDFSSNCSIGKSYYLCLELTDELSASEILRSLPCSQHLGNLTLTNGESFRSSSKLVPVITCPHDSAVAYEILFQLNSLVHLQKISWGQVSIELIDILSRLSLETALKILKKLQKLKTTCYEPVRFIHSQLANMKNQKTLPSNKSIQAENLMSCHRVLVTPSRVYFLGPELETSNYVVKHYSAYASDFLRVSFVEEDWGKLPSDALSTLVEHGILSNPYRTDIHKRVSSILRDGIFIGSKKFEFLAFSASQLRANSVWMFASNDSLTAESIREWMGHFNKINSVSKCAARMGQLFSSSSQTFDVPPRDVQIITDVEVITDGVKYCFSDGIGKISLAFARQVAKKCGLNRTPSAFQIRYGGYKGVVAVDRTSFRKLSLRPSMKKFDSTNAMLNITKWSESLPCYLNREIVSLLSTLGIKDEIFELMLHDQMRHLDEMLSNKDIALTELGRMAGAESRTAVKMLMHGYEPSSEPYLSMMLRAYRSYQLSDIKSRCRISVQKGRLLIGCLDETGTLNYGQVYLRVSLTEEELRDKDQIFFDYYDQTTAVVVGKVVVTKNPCLHPGDIRVLQAVYDHQVDDTGLIDCIVFPQKGERPHPNECSGGDLDGDLYFVCWDENLVPLTTETPMDYVARRPRLMDHEVTLQEIQKFFLDYMINDTLGVISNAHLVYADRESSKARSPQCLQLAKLHSMAVDFAKTGAAAEMPRILKPREFPDFMERLERPMYTSTGVLGKLYRATYDKTEKAMFEPVELDAISHPPYDYDLEVEGFEAFLGAAEGYRDQYSDRLSSLMNYYGAEHEDEILTGNLRNKAVYLQRDKNKYGDMKDRMLIAVRSLQNEVEGWFKHSCYESDSARMASAWYHVTYHPNYYSTTNFLSFPWILSDVLLSIKDSKRLKALKGGCLAPCVSNVNREAE